MVDFVHKFSTGQKVKLTDEARVRFNNLARTTKDLVVRGYGDPTDCGRMPTVRVGTDEAYIGLFREKWFESAEGPW